MKSSSPSPDRNDTRPTRNVWWLSWASFFTDVHSETIMPLLPFFLRDVFSASYTLIGAMEGLADGLSSGVKILSGYLSDRLGRRKPLVAAGYILSWTAKLLLVWAPGAAAVFTLRVIDRAGKGLRTSPRDALLADSAQRSRRGAAYGLHRAMDTGGALVGTLLAWGLLWMAWAYSRIFLIAALPGLVAWLLILLRVRDRPPPADTAPQSPATSPYPTGIWVFIFLHCTFSFAYLNYALLLLLLTDLAGIPTQWAPGLYLWFNLVYAATALPIGRLADRRDIRKLLLLGYTLFGFTYLSCFMVTAWKVVGALVTFAGYAVGVAAVETLPRAYLGKLVRRVRRGTVMGLYHGLYGATFFAGNLGMGWIWSHFGWQIMVLTLVGIIGVTLVLFLGIMRKLPQSS